MKDPIGEAIGVFEEDAIDVELPINDFNKLKFSSEEPKPVKHVQQKDNCKDIILATKRFIADGVIGEELYKQLSQNFKASRLRAAAGKIKELNVKHAGLSGRVYVDSSLYFPHCRTMLAAIRGSGFASTIKHVFANKGCSSCINRNGDTCNTCGMRLITSSKDLDEDDARDVSNFVSRDAVRFASSLQETDAQIRAMLLFDELPDVDEGDERVGQFDFQSLGDIEVEDKEEKEPELPITFGTAPSQFV